MRQSTYKGDDEKRKLTIDMVTKLYVNILKSNSEVSSNEVSILYTLLTNLFSRLDVSWEAYVRQIIEEDFDIERVYEYLDKHLSLLDKTRLVQSLVIMSGTDAEYNISDLTEIANLCKVFKLNSESFIQLINYFENKTGESPILSCLHHYAHIKHSVFSDYLLFGVSIDSDIRFRREELMEYEGAIYSVGQYLFFLSGASTNVLINDELPKPQSISILNDEATINIAGTTINWSCINSIYTSRDQTDEIVFKKTNYDFIILKSCTSYSIQVFSGLVTLNGKELYHGRHYDIFYDDTIQIKGYAPFHLTTVIENRSSIGLDDLVPKNLYLCNVNGFYSLNRSDNQSALASFSMIDGELHISNLIKDNSLFVNKISVTEPTKFTLNTDTLTIDKRNFKINSFYDLVEIPIEFSCLSIVDIKHYFSDGKIALDSISFSAFRSQMIGILGQSGCGKSTLTKIISTEYRPTYGQVYIDGIDIFSNSRYFSEFLAYVPQDDLLYPYLTVYENLWYRIKLMMPSIDSEIHNQKINNILNQVGLNHHRNTKVGEYKTKNLSGGERKRLNMALELLFEPTLIICDEPTSGLSFNDAEQIIGILKSQCEQGKIVIMTIHQPNSNLYKMFDKVMLMDAGGRMVFFGTPSESFEYFDEEIELLSIRKSDIDRKRIQMTSDFFYDLITYPSYDKNGSIVFEQVNKSIQQKRMFTPEYWRDKFKRKVLYDMIQNDQGLNDFSQENSAIYHKYKKRFTSIRSQLNLIFTYISRSFQMKARNKTNNFITFLEAPILAIMISFILRQTASNEYSYYENNNVFVFLFVSVIAFVFLGLSNSIEDIFTERKIIQRESALNIRVSFYQFSKLVTLSAYSLLQVLLYFFISSLILGIRGLTWISISYLFLSSFIGFSMGLMCSSFIRENRTVTNLLPLILIPQIIFGGAIIEYERMNKNLRIYERHPIPELVQLIPSRWLFEGIATAYAKNTAFHRSLSRIQKKELTHLARYRKAEISKNELQMMRIISYNERKLVSEKWNPDRVLNLYLNTAVGIMDGKVLNNGRNEFMSSIKIIGNRRMRTWVFNALIVLLIAMFMNLVTWIKLKYYFID